MAQHLGRSAVIEVTPGIIADNVVAWVRSHPTWHWQDVLAHYARVFCLTDIERAQARRLVRRRWQGREQRA
jgi:hypothetical protein